MIYFPSAHSYKLRYILVSKQFTTFFFIFIASLFGYVLAKALFLDHRAHNSPCTLLCVFCPKLWDLNQVSFQDIKLSRKPLLIIHDILIWSTVQ